MACAQPIDDETDRPGQDVGEQALRFAARQGRRRALETASALSAELGEGFTVLTLQENKSVATAERYCEKVFVIYNLTNMNIGERKREIATLAVLGYRGREILGYIYRGRS